MGTVWNPFPDPASSLELPIIQYLLFFRRSKVGRFSYHCRNRASLSTLSQNQGRGAHSSVCGLFKWRQFEPEIILLAVGWYLRFSLSYRDIEELLAERGFLVDHVIVWRWVQRYAPEIQRRLRPRLRLTNDSWQVDETYIRVKGKWVYLYRAVDSTGATIDFLLSARRDAQQRPSALWPKPCAHNGSSAQIAGHTAAPTAKWSYGPRRCRARPSFGRDRES